jgi:hypothetical protein
MGQRGVELLRDVRKNSRENLIGDEGDGDDLAHPPEYHGGSRGRHGFSNPEHAACFGFGQGQCRGAIAHRPAAATPGNLLDLPVLPRGRYAQCAFEHVARRGEYARLDGHVTLGLLECHTSSFNSRTHSYGGMPDLNYTDDTVKTGKRLPPAP